MPKVNYTNTKGLYQETGSGINLSKGETAYRLPSIIISSAGTTALLASQSGTKVFFIGSGNPAGIATLPIGSTCSVGTIFHFEVGFDNTGGWEVQSTVSGENILGKFPVYGSVDDKSAASTGPEADALVLNLTSGNAAKSGGEGSVFSVMWNGTDWLTWGKLTTNGANPSSVDVFTTT
jgi:hypothetical protein